jgi:hypothetical protein
MTIIVNGKSMWLTTPWLTFEEIVSLAECQQADTVTWRSRLGGTQGMLRRGETVVAADGMVINASMTNRA